MLILLLSISSIEVSVIQIHLHIFLGVIDELLEALGGRRQPIVHWFVEQVLQEAKYAKNVHEHRKWRDEIQVCLVL